MFNRKLPYVMAAALMGFAACSVPAHAQWGYGGNIDSRQQMIYNQLNRGLSSGRLTQREYNRLLSRYNHVNSVEARLRAGGLNWRERQRLNNQLSNLQMQLRRDLFDRQSAGNWRGRWY